MTKKLEDKAIQCIVYVAKIIIDSGSNIDSNKLYSLLKTVYKNGYRRGMRKLKTTDLVSDKNQPRLPYL